MRHRSDRAVWPASAYSLPRAAQQGARLGSNSRARPRAYSRWSTVEPHAPRHAHRSALDGSMRKPPVIVCYNEHTGHDKRRPRLQGRCTGILCTVKPGLSGNISPCNSPVQSPGNHSAMHVPNKCCSTPFTQVTDSLHSASASSGRSRTCARRSCASM